MTAMTETELKMEGMALLIRHLGEVQAETFISLMLREPFDYTEWQRNLWVDKSIDDLIQMAHEQQEDKQ